MSFSLYSTGSLDGKEFACNAGDLGSIHGPRRSPGEGKKQPTPVLLPGEPHEIGAWRARVHGIAESDSTE